MSISSASYPPMPPSKETVRRKGSVPTQPAARPLSPPGSSTLTPVARHRVGGKPTDTRPSCRAGTTRQAGGGGRYGGDRFDAHQQRTDTRSTSIHRMHSAVICMHRSRAPEIKAGRGTSQRPVCYLPIAVFSLLTHVKLFRLTRCGVGAVLRGENRAAEHQPASSESGLVSAFYLPAESENSRQYSTTRTQNTPRSSRGQKIPNICAHGTAKFPNLERPTALPEPG